MDGYSITDTCLQANPAGSSAVTTKAGRNATITSLMVCCGFIVCWTPNQILFFLGFIGLPVDYGSWFYHFTVVLVVTNSCINPFIYAAKYREFQNGVRRLVACLARQPNQIHSQNETG